MLGRGPEHEVSIGQLAERVSKSRKTVVDALGFGAFLDFDMAEAIIESFGLRWKVGVDGGYCERAGGGRAEPLPQMPGLVRLRRILEASNRGWLRYVDEPSPNKARWLRQFQLMVGGQEYVVLAEGLDAWLDGLAAFHGSDAQAGMEPGAGAAAG
jgi:hypothetical protein